MSHLRLPNDGNDNDIGRSSFNKRRACILANIEKISVHPSRKVKFYETSRTPLQYIVNQSLLEKIDLVTRDVHTEDCNLLPMILDISYDVRDLPFAMNHNAIASRRRIIMRIEYIIKPNLLQLRGARNMRNDDSKKNSDDLRGNESNHGGNDNGKKSANNINNRLNERDINLNAGIADKRAGVASGAAINMNTNIAGTTGNIRASYRQYGQFTIIDSIEMPYSGYGYKESITELRNDISERIANRIIDDVGARNY